MAVRTYVGLKGGARAWKVAEWVRSERAPAVVVCPTEKDAASFYEELQLFTASVADVVRFPEDDFDPYDLASPDPEDAARRVEALWKLHAAGLGDVERPPLVVTSLRGAMRKTIPRETLAQHLEYIVVNEEVDRDGLLDFLARAGYHRVSLVEDLGTFAVRGGILDVFPPLHEEPLRIELFGDEVESIRPFNVRNQRSRKQSLEELVIVPVREIVFAGEHSAPVIEKLPADSREAESIRQAFFFSGVETYLPWFYPDAETLCDYLPRNGAVFRIDSIAHEQQQTQFLEQAAAAFEVATGQDDRVVPEPTERFSDKVAARARIDLAELEVGEAAEVSRVTCEPTAGLRKEIEAAPHDAMLEPLARRVRAWQADKTKVVFVVHQPSQGERLLYLLSRYRVHVILDEEKGAARDLADPRSALRTNTEEVTVLLGDLASGFHLPAEKLVILSESDVFGARIRRRRARAGAESEAIRSLSDLKPGDLVVHRDYGLGVFRGVKQLESTAPNRPALEWLPGSGDGPAPPAAEFVHLEYLGGDKIYMPVYRMNLIERYRGEEGAVRLDKLGGVGWQNRKKRVKAAVKKMARELLDLYARREVASRRPYGAPEELPGFEAEFAYDETPDQRAAIEEVFSDLDKPNPMDRLVCGDVGFGKTEVALRAAFRVAMNGRQVAVLVPTTLLAQQHERTFHQRFKDYPVKVGQLSRFVPAPAQKEAMQQLADGRLDVVIGTTRLLSKDVKFRDLGLLVVDEEHRFGVKHKEKIKQLRTKVDVLTLTATPIPRTLHMSMTGLRDLSVIETPPEDRLPVRTFVNKFDEPIVREAIMRELQRGGQVYFLHNRVQTIGSMASRISHLVPEARVGIAHGQMGEKELAQVMVDFLDKKYDVLVCTAIVESGLDIPSANTLVVNRADRFGLAQLYQIRGRVGRSAQRAYAYLLVPGVDLVTQGALDRLQTLQEFTDLGSGFRIAERDMELRGVGNLLGANQHGHINAVGYDYYLHLLSNAIAEIKGEEPEPTVEPEINLKLAALLPNTYIDDAKARVGYYRRLAASRTDEEIEEVRDEIRDRFGPLPAPVKNLVGIIRIKTRMARLGVSSLDAGAGKLVFTLIPENAIEPEQLVQLVSAEPKRYKLNPDGRFVVKIRDADPIPEALRLLDLLAA